MTHNNPTVTTAAETSDASDDLFDTTVAALAAHPLADADRSPVAQDGVLIPQAVVTQLRQGFPTDCLYRIEQDQAPPGTPLVGDTERPPSDDTSDTGHPSSPQAATEPSPQITVTAVSLQQTLLTCTIYRRREAGSTQTRRAYLSRTGTAVKSLIWQQIAARTDPTSISVSHLATEPVMRYLDAEAPATRDALVTMLDATTSDGSLTPGGADCTDTAGAAGSHDSNRDTNDDTSHDTSRDTTSSQTLNHSPRTQSHD